MVESSDSTAGDITGDITAENVLVESVLNVHHELKDESEMDGTLDGMVTGSPNGNGNGTLRELGDSVKEKSLEPSPPVKSSRPSSKSPVRRASSRLSQQKTLKNVPTLNASPIIHERKKRKVQTFVEPDLAEPSPAYTGLPLETFPTAKIKKESLWPVKKAKSTSNSREPTRDLSPDVEFDQQTFEQCNRGLKTTLSEDLTVASEIREPLKIKLRQRTDTPRQPKRPALADTPPSRLAKKIKIRSPVKVVSANLAPSSIPNQQGDEKSEDDPTKDNDDYCSSCGGSGVFICCETCPKSFHFTCCEPPLEEPPIDDWNCRECIAERHPSICTKWDNIGIFSKLMNQQESRNPTEFELPRDLRENTFIGVSTGDHGEYLDDSTKPELSYSKSNGSQISGYNKNDDLEIDSLYDKDSNPLFCHKCGESGLYHRTLTHCDYCPLVWHIDCLPEPIFGPKTIGTKWKCPNHVDNPRREFKDTKVVDASLHNHFLHIAHSNMLIQHADQPKLVKYPNLQEYIQYENDDFARPNEDFDARKREDVNEAFRVPDYLSSQSFLSGIKARASKDLAKVLCLTSPGPNKEAFIYRVPESLIMLDFLTKVKQLSGIKKQVLENITDYENLSRLETNDEDREIVDGLIRVKTEPSHKIDFNELINIAVKHEGKRPKRKTKLMLKDKEIADLLNIKRLMEMKGRDELVRFLTEDNRA